MSDANRELAAKLYELFTAANIGEITTLLAEDFVLENPLPAIIPFGGTYEGAAGFVEYAQGIGAAIAIEDFGIDRILCDGDHVAVAGRERSRVVSTGRTYAMEWVHVLRIANGRIHHLREYNDTAAMLAAFEHKA